MDTDTTDQDGEQSSIDFSPRSPWSQPPIHRPAPRPDPATGPRWTRRDVLAQAPADGEQTNGGRTYQGGLQLSPDAEEPTIDDGSPPPYDQYDTQSAAPQKPASLSTLATTVPIHEYAYEAPAPVHPYTDLEVGLQYPVPTADEFTARRTVRPRDWVATTGVRAAARRGTFGLVRLRPNRREREGRANIAAVRRVFGGLRQITVVNPKGGAGKTVATLMLGLAFGHTRGGFVLGLGQQRDPGHPRDAGTARRARPNRA